VDAARAAEVLGWRPTVTLEHGLTVTVTGMVTARAGRRRRGAG